jgi:hypothetical protein
MKIPPHKLESVYNAVAVFTLPKTFIDVIIFYSSSEKKGIAFHIGARDDTVAAEHAMPNAIVGYSEIVDEYLKKLY